MSRGLDSSFKTAAAAGNVRPALIAYFDFSGGAVRVWSGYGDLVWDSQTWSGIGDFGQVSPVQESGAVRANKLQFRLNGVPQDMVGRILLEGYRGRACKLWLALFNDAGAMVSSPALLFAGRMDQCVGEDKGSESAIFVNAENRLVELQRPRERRRNDQDQQNIFPGDRGLEYVAGLQDKELTWGANTSSTNGLSAAAAAGVGRETSQVE